MSVDAPRVEERYLRASLTSDLSTNLAHACDADKLLAAAYASMRGENGERRRLALRVWRVGASGDLGGAHELASLLGLELVGRSMSRGYLRRGTPAIPRVIGHDIAMTVLKWWSKPACPACHGRGHPVIAHTPMLDTTRNCPECHGTGKVDLARLVRTEHSDAALWLASEMQSLSAVVFSDMARLLRDQMDL
jgi:hypothetical protein